MLCPFLRIDVMENLLNRITMERPSSFSAREEQSSSSSSAMLEQ